MSLNFWRTQRGIGNKYKIILKAAKPIANAIDAAISVDSWGSAFPSLSYKKSAAVGHTILFEGVQFITRPVNAALWIKVDAYFVWVPRVVSWSHGVNPL